MIGTIKQTKNMYIVPARIILCCLMPGVVSFLLIFPLMVVFYFLDVCEYINMYY